MLRRHNHFLLALCALIISACGSSHPQAGDSNTNWLRECSRAADCSGDLSCSCGVCTVACTTDAICERSDDAPATCVSLSEAQCGGASKGAVCAARCKQDDDCATDFSCITGGCVQTMSAPAASSDAGGPRASTPDASEPGSSSNAGNARDAALPANECSEPGACPDTPGETTVAPVSGDIRRVIATAGAIFVLDHGTTDSLGNVHKDGSIKRVEIATGSVETVIDGLDRPLDFMLDADHVYWAGGMNGSELWSATRADGSDPIKLASIVNLAFTQDASALYFLTEQGGQTQLMRMSKGTTTSEPMTSMNWQGSYWLGSDGEYVYVPSDSGNFRVSIAGGDPELINTLDGASAVDAENLFFVEIGGHSIYTASKQGGDPVTLAIIEQPAFLSQMVVFRDHVYFSTRPGGAQGDATIARAPLDPNDAEQLAAMSDPGNNGVVFDVSDSGVFWLEDSQLKRKTLDDLTDSSEPAQGAPGAPCFHDLTCDAGLQCSGLRCK